VPVLGASEESVDLAVRQEPGGTTFYAFSDESALPPGARYVPMPAPVLAGVVLADPGATLVVDPGTADAGRVSRSELELVRDRHVPGSGGVATAAPGAALRVFPLAKEPPAALLAVLREEASRHPGIVSVHLFEGSFTTGERHAFVGVRLAGGLAEHQRVSTLTAIGRAAAGHLAGADVAELHGELLGAAAAVGRLVYASGD
jgi:hypothetical protein